MKQKTRITIVLTVAIIVGVIFFYEKSIHSDKQPFPDSTSADKSVELTEAQLKSIKVEMAGERSFADEREAFGSVAYHERDPMLGALPGNAEPGSASKFIVANVSESDSPLIHVGQPTQAKVAAYPDRIFIGKVSALGVTVYDSGGNPAIDPNTHRITLRCKIIDPKNELYPGMLATILIQVQDPAESVAIPVNGVVRKGDGTMTVWVTKDRHHFSERTVRVGLRQDGYAQITEGLQSKELVATDGAVFLSNMLYAPPTD
jgi:cobalt-zinc-cadmium efflux system membrane fusion protein